MRAHVGPAVTPSPPLHVSPPPLQVARRRNEAGFEELYNLSRCGNGASILCLLVFASGKGCMCYARSSVAGLGALMTAALEAILA